ncbi:hypothetical protein BKA70DRAFT_836487 [Coprinopsis sp. MPI-PUGE-AT-0042]|nr:hypothetical protein BKA70DRAFT_836487 [Coprinopsis sp. MPI-PUGE-AT-0042]
MKFSITSFLLIATLGASQVLAYSSYDDFEARDVAAYEDDFALRDYDASFEARYYDDVAEDVFARASASSVFKSSKNLVDNAGKKPKRMSSRRKSKLDSQAKAIQAELKTIPKSDLGEINAIAVEDSLKYFHKSALVLQKYAKEYETAKASKDKKKIAAAAKKVAEWKENTGVFMWGVLANGAKDRKAFGAKISKVKAAKKESKMKVAKALKEAAKKTKA